ncbi:hypothetical protein QKU48_gp1254 [Fadolivirus algeromassiliense]|jgi:hypothetical protein|uniref:Uncharacterized protein n=1 Tax=Fadolivirus FV1/VV64 TaxID=3070911 RepID=A0A7D3V616_9VIRU|nr:hypothetical protein QKU48_gp1254 [Fadolivirus algeromassiliense]QKF94712.1 hypothetical protein Fadolivirus_1_1254 [Fadolivirus FV1/VV64]
MNDNKIDVFYVTYLCIGKFIDKHNVSVVRKTKIGLDYPIIETNEWECGLVNKDNLETYLSNKCNKEAMCKFCYIIPDKIKLVPDNTHDLFIEESYDTSINNVYRETFSDYILVEKNYSYIIDDND